MVRRPPPTQPRQPATGSGHGFSPRAGRIDFGVKSGSGPVSWDEVSDRNTVAVTKHSGVSASVFSAISDGLNGTSPLYTWSWRFALRALRGAYQRRFLRKLESRRYGSVASPDIMVRGLPPVIWGRSEGIDVRAQILFASPIHPTIRDESKSDTESPRTGGRLRRRNMKRESTVPVVNAEGPQPV